jgi:hypothetical protein
LLSLLTDEVGGQGTPHSPWVSLAEVREGRKEGREDDRQTESRYFEEDGGVMSAGRQTGVAVVASSNKSVGLVDFARSITASSGGERERSSLTPELGRNREYIYI